MKTDFYGSDAVGSQFKNAPAQAGRMKPSRPMRRPDNLGKGSRRTEWLAEWRQKYFPKAAR